MKLPWDKICIINLKQHKTRLESTLNQLHRENLIGNKCVEAVYGYDFVPYGKQIKKEKNRSQKNKFLKSMRKGLEKNNILKRTKYRPLRIGEIGCTMSIINTFKKALDQGLNTLLMLEDDCKLSTDFLKKVNDVMTFVPNNWDILYLGINPINKKWGSFKKINKVINKPKGSKKLSDKRYIESEGAIYGTHAFIVNRKAMELFIEYNLPMTYPADVILGKLATQYKLINSYSLAKQLVTTFNAGSTTQ
jgi:GR25 family glycosyltransferase involved in LPS biosynthesis